VVVISSPEQTGSPHSNSWLPVDHRGEVHADLGVEDRRAHRRRAVDDAEHRRRDDLAEARRQRGILVEVDRVLGPDHVRVLGDLGAARLVCRRRPFLPHRFGVHRHSRNLFKAMTAARPRR
jgi:hypothetical protein